MNILARLADQLLCHYAMFVRFRRQANRLQASLIETRRASGKVVAEHYTILSTRIAERPAAGHGYGQCFA
jgi:hypothetical protein